MSGGAAQVVVKRVVIHFAETAPEFKKLRENQGFQDLLKEVKRFKDPDKMPRELWKEFYFEVLGATAEQHQIGGPKPFGGGTNEQD